jgi:hypothetical protein
MIKQDIWILFLYFYYSKFVKRFISAGSDGPD